MALFGRSNNNGKDAMGTPDTTAHIQLNASVEFRIQLAASPVFNAFQTSLEEALRAASIPLAAIVVTTTERRPPNYADEEVFSVGPVLGGRTIEFRFQDKGNSTHLFKCQILSNTSKLSTEALRAIVKGFEENRGKSTQPPADDSPYPPQNNGMAEAGGGVVAAAQETDAGHADVVEEAGGAMAPEPATADRAAAEGMLPTGSEAEALQQAMAIISEKIDKAAPLHRKLVKLRRDRDALDLQITETELEYAAALREQLTAPEHKALVAFLKTANK